MLLYLINSQTYNEHIFTEKEWTMDNNIKIDDINKLIFHWPWAGYSGNFFLDGIMDFHPELLTIKEFGLSAFGCIYRDVLRNKTVVEGIDLLKHPQTESQKSLVSTEWDTMFKNARFLSDTASVPEIDNFYEKLEEMLSQRLIPTKLEWFKGIFLAYNLALGRSFSAENPPAIFLNMHSIKWPVVDAKKEIWDLLDQFDDLKIISILRSQLGTLGSVMNAESYNNGQSEYDYISYFESILNKTALYADPDDKWYAKRAVVRFEDLKMHLKETTEALCRFLEIHWDKSMLAITANGKINGYVYGGTNTQGLDLKPVYNLHLNAVGYLDFYRLEILKGNYYLPWGYEPKFYDGVLFSDDELASLFALPFKFEKFVNSEKQIEINKAAHKRLESLIRELKEHPIPCQNNGQEKIPVRWLKPDISDDKLFH